MTRVLLLIPPFTQLNAPYPSVPALTRFLRNAGHEAHQADLSLETTLALFSRPGLTRLFDILKTRPGPLPERITWALEMAGTYLETVDPVISFLQDRDTTLAHRLCHGGMLPEGPRFDSLDEDGWAFGTLGTTDRARHLCTLYLEDLADLVKEVASPHYDFSRYGERLVLGATSFDRLADALEAPQCLIDELLEQVLKPILEKFLPEVVGFTVPFPGTLYGALRSAEVVKDFNPAIVTVMGGGYVNTELRQLKTPRLFDRIDYVLLDDGERPLLCLLEHLAGKRDTDGLKRSFLRKQGHVTWRDGAPEPDCSSEEAGFPTYEGLPLDRYLSLLEVLNPMHRLWSEGRWNKLAAAHGCYWKKCAFCDVNLPQIAVYHPMEASDLVNRMETLVQETSQRGFHFVDEAMPPALMREMALEILRRGLTISWWGNIRFEKAFTPDLCRLLAASGCIAVTGGLEAASDRLLALMNKGVRVSQAARACAAFAGASIMVHVYLMYGFPTQTEEEFVDSLERVRQFFDAGLIQSAFWHRFYATAHSPIGSQPADYHIRVTGPQPGDFAFNDLEFEDPEGENPELYGPGLDSAVRHYMQGEGLDDDVRRWFDRPLSPTRVPPELVAGILAEDRENDTTTSQKTLVWLGGPVSWREQQRSGQKRGKMGVLELNTCEGKRSLRMDSALGPWMEALLNESRPRGQKAGCALPFDEVVRRFPGEKIALERFFRSPAWRTLREAGLVLV